MMINMVWVCKIDRLKATLKKESLKINHGLNLELWNWNRGYRTARKEINSFPKGESTGIGDRLDMKMKTTESKITQ